MMIRTGTAHTAISILVECDHLGAYTASWLEARYFQANRNVMTMTGTTTNSISSVAVMIRFRSSRPTWPLGSSKVMLQPDSNNLLRARRGPSQPRTLRNPLADRRSPASGTGSGLPRLLDQELQKDELQDPVSPHRIADKSALGQPELRQSVNRLA